MCRASPREDGIKFLARFKSNSEKQKQKKIPTFQQLSIKRFCKYILCHTFPPVEGILPVFYSHTTEGQGYYSEQTAESAVVTSVQGGGPADGLEKGCVHHPDLTGQSYSYQSTLPAQCQVGGVKIKSNILHFVGLSSCK